jgi:hypothetical protein
MMENKRHTTQQIAQNARTYLSKKFVSHPQETQEDDS